MELFRALAVLVEPPCSETARLAELLNLGEEPTSSEFTDLFVFQLYPYASVYLGEGGMLGGEARDRVAGFWRALGQAPPAEPDHLAVMLALYARLAELDREATADLRLTHRHVRGTFFWEHLASWLPVYLEKLARIAPPLYRAWGRLLQEAVTNEASQLTLPDRLPLHLREAPLLPSLQTEGTEKFLAGLLAPVHSGMILTRSDLARAARDLDLGLRAGERRFVLQALFDQDASGTLNWLRDESHACVDRYRTLGGWSPAVARFWMERASQTADVLGGLSDVAAAEHEGIASRVAE
jgi:TorA maturation chaperone TorD